MLIENPGPFMPSGVYDHRGRCAGSGWALGSSDQRVVEEERDLEEAEAGRAIERAADWQLHCRHALAGAVSANRGPLSAIAIVCPAIDKKPGVGAIDEAIVLLAGFSFCFIFVFFFLSLGDASQHGDQSLIPWPVHC